MNTLARVSFALGRKDEAERLYQETLRTQSRVLGPEHPETLATMKDLADAYTQEGRIDDAERLLTTAVQGMRRVLGENHPDTVAAVTDLADLRAKLSKK
jgi:lipopolysaccharide biosynthesis regulator YciM